MSEKRRVQIAEWWEVNAYDGTWGKYFIRDQAARYARALRASAAHMRAGVRLVHVRRYRVRT